jgi:hypothetical protein
MTRVRHLVLMSFLTLLTLSGAVVALAGEARQQPAAAKKDFPGIEKLMSADDFARAGLDKLTPEQLQALDAWLLRYTAGEAYVVQSTSREVQSAVGEFRVEASILPPFTGWEGATVFRLDNGQVWRQRISGRYRHSGDDTRVVITRNFLGFYVLKLESTGRTIGVEPVKQ